MVDYQIYALEQSKSNVNRIYLFIGLHLVLGLACSVSSIIGFAWAVFVFAFCAFHTFAYSNKSNIAAYGAIYITSLEIVLRINRVPIFYEFGKYAVSCLFLIALLVEPKETRKIPLLALLYMGFLLPSLVMVDYDGYEQMRRMISFNLSGPFCLTMSLLYFYKRKFNKDEIRFIFTLAILPIISALASIVYKMPALDDISFDPGGSNKMLSGGFGPNQVSTALSYGFSIIGMAWILDISITKRTAYDLIIGFTFLAFSALTFSRGGITASLASFAIAMFIKFIYGNNLMKVLNTAFGIAIFILIAIFVMIKVNDFTGDALSQRYDKALHKSDKFGRKEEVDINVSGRMELANSELIMFRDNPFLGVGPGMASLVRNRETGGDVVPSHTEFTRLLSEHGLYGLMIIIIIIFMPINEYRYLNLQEKLLLAGFISLSLFTQLHSAMRLAMPAVIYGFAFASINFYENPLETLEEAEE